MFSVVIFIRCHNRILALGLMSRNLAWRFRFAYAIITINIINGVYVRGIKKDMVWNKLNKLNKLTK